LPKPSLTEAVAEGQHTGEVANVIVLDQANDENVSGYDFLHALVSKMMNDQSQESTVKKPLTAAFRGVERDKAYGSYLVRLTIAKLISSTEKKT
jgi:hypothetical protein